MASIRIVVTGPCEGRPGSAGFEEIDAKTFASWGVDYVKTDAWPHGGGHCNDVGMICGVQGYPSEVRYIPLKFWYHHHNIPRWYLIVFFGGFDI